MRTFGVLTPSAHLFLYLFPAIFLDGEVGVWAPDMVSFISFADEFSSSLATLNSRFLEVFSADGGGGGVECAIGDEERGRNMFFGLFGELGGFRGGGDIECQKFSPSSQILELRWLMSGFGEGV